MDGSRSAWLFGWRTWITGIEIAIIVIVVGIVIASFSPLMDVLRDIVAGIFGYDRARTESTMKLIKDIADREDLTAGEKTELITAIEKTVSKATPPPPGITKWIPWIAAAILGIVIAPQLPYILKKS